MNNKNDVVFTIKNKVLDIIRDENDCITLDNIDDFFELNSLEYLTLVVYLENYYDIEIEDEQLTMDSFKTIEGLADYILKRKKVEYE